MALQRWEFLWPGWIPRGELTILGGRQGTGKGVLLASVAAMACGFKDWPDGHGTEGYGSVLWVGVEDHPEKTVLPRCEYAGLPREHVDFLVPPMLPREHSPASYMLANGLPDSGIRLVIADPLIEGMDADANASTKSRQHADLWAQVARKFDVGVVGVMHNVKWSKNKVNESGDLVDMIAGSHQWTATARAVLLYVRDENDHDAPRVLARVKANFDVKPAHYAYRVSGEQGDRDGPMRIAGFQPEPEPHAAIMRMVSGDAGNQEVSDAILECIENHGGAAASTDVQSEVADKLGVDKSTVRRRASKMVGAGDLLMAQKPGTRAKTWSLPPADSP